MKPKLILKPRPPKEYAKVVWSVKDVQKKRPNWSDKVARKFLQQNADHIKDRLTDFGWDLLDILVQDYEIDEKERMRELVL